MPGEHVIEPFVSQRQKTYIPRSTVQHRNAMADQNHVQNVAIVGAAGRSGKAIVKALLQTRKHNVTAVTRPESTNVMPEGLHAINKADYNDHGSLVAALQGRDVLIITMAVMAAPDSSFKLVDAAVEAGVRYIMPNEWGVLATAEENPGIAKDLSMMTDRIIAVREHIEKVGKGKMHWIGLCCGFWYEFSLAGTEARYGFDFEKKHVTLYDEGTTKINTSTWPQVGRAVAALLSLPIESGDGPCLRQWHDRTAACSSFFVNQRDMFESVLRVTGDKESDWTVSHEDVVERYKRGWEMMKRGQMVGFGILLYARVFYEDGAGNFDDRIDNEVLGLPKEDFDRATKVGIEMAAAGDTNAIH